MARLPQVLLGNLQLDHVRRLTDLVEDGAVRFTGLEIKGTVLGLQDDIVAELTVQRLELRHGLLDAILAFVVGSVDKAAPHDDAWGLALGRGRLQGVGQHVGTVGMAAVVVARTGLALAVGLDEEAPEVGDELVYLVGFLLPPAGYGRAEGVGSLGVAQGHWGSEVDA